MMQTKKIFTSVSIALAMAVFCMAQSCHSSYDEGSAEGHYDTVQQSRSSDRTMSNQQHDGSQPVQTDSTATVDTSMAN